jgi:hypothetical protein
MIGLVVQAAAVLMNVYTGCQKSSCLKITTKHETRDECLAVFKIAGFFLLPLAYRLLPVFI